MKIYITGYLDNKNLLKKIQKNLRYLNFESFIVGLDLKKSEQQNFGEKRIMQLQDSDIIVFLQDGNSKNIVYQNELGYAIAGDKQTIGFLFQEDQNINLFNELIKVKSEEDFFEKFDKIFGLDIGRIMIDEIDNEIIELIKERFLVVNRIGKYKKIYNISALQPERWKKVLESKKKIAKELGVEVDMIEKIWNIMHDFALKTEK